MNFKRLLCWLLTGHRTDSYIDDDRYTEDTYGLECWCGNYVGNRP